MDLFIKAVTDINGAINSFIWNYGVFLLVGVGLLLTIVTKVFRISHVGHWWRETIGSLFKKDSSSTKKTDKKTISQLQALCTALAATVGTGNIAGVAAAIVLGWSQYGSKAVEYLFGVKGVKVYKVIFVLMIVSGAVMTSSLAWDISDTFNGLMMIPNLIGVVALFPLVMKITKNYVNRKTQKADT